MAAATEPPIMAPLLLLELDVEVDVDVDVDDVPVEVGFDVIVEAGELLSIHDESSDAPTVIISVAPPVRP